MESLNKIFLPESPLNNKKVIYTDSAKARLNDLHSTLDLKFEEYFQNEKYVPGDDFIEITASDILLLESRIKIIKSRRIKMYFTRFVLQLYFLLGVIGVMAGLYYEELQNLFKGDKERLTFIAGGTILIFASIFLNYYVKIREQKEDEITPKKENFDLNLDLIEKYIRLEKEKDLPPVK